jgi:hypothetical protein
MLTSSDTTAILRAGPVPYCQTGKYFTACFVLTGTVFYINFKVIPELNYLYTMPRRRIGEWRCSSTFFNLDTRWSWVVSFMSLSFYFQGSNSQYMLHRSQGRPQSQSERNGKEKHLLPITVCEPRLLGRPFHTLIATPTELSASVQARRQEEIIPSSYSYLVEKVIATPACKARSCTVVFITPHQWALLRVTCMQSIFERSLI